MKILDIIALAGRCPTSQGSMKQWKGWKMAHKYLVNSRVIPGTPISSGILMGIVWQAYHKGVPYMIAIYKSGQSWYFSSLQCVDGFHDRKKNS